jgi:hypothetical protein
MTNATLTTKFEVGKTYHSENGVKTYTVLRRTEKTVWLETEDNKTIQKRIKVTNFGNEKITDNFLETTSDCEATTEPQTTLEPVTESQDKTEDSDDDDMFLFDLLDEMFAALTPPTNP